MDVLKQQGEAFDHEKEGNLDEAIKIYWQLIDSGFDGSNPYEQLRKIYAKQKNWEGAIKACQAYIDLEKTYSGHAIKEKRMKEWIRKYRQRIEPNDIYISSESILKKSIQEASSSSKQRYHSTIPEHIPLDSFPDWTQNDLVKIKVPTFEQYYPSRDLMNKTQLAFFNTWIAQWQISRPICVDNNISYLFAYTYEVLDKVKKDPNSVLQEFRLLQYVYRNEEQYRSYIDSWTFDVFLLKSDYIHALSFIAAKKEMVQRRINSTLSLKKEIGVPISGFELLTLSKRTSKIVKENAEAISELIEEKVRSLEEECLVD